jgi:excisionase family DNA binding protein
VSKAERRRGGISFEEKCFEGERRTGRLVCAAHENNLFGRLIRKWQEGVVKAMKTVFSTLEAAKVCQVSEQTIIHCFDSGQLKGYRLPGSRDRRIPREALFRFMEETGIPTDNLDREDIAEGSPKELNIQADRPRE